MDSQKIWETSPTPVGFEARSVCDIFLSYSYLCPEPEFVEAYGRFVEEAFPDKPLIITEASYLPRSSAKDVWTRHALERGVLSFRYFFYSLTKWIQHILFSSYFKLICFIAVPARLLEVYMLDMYLCLPVAVVVVVMDGWFDSLNCTGWWDHHPFFPEVYQTGIFLQDMMPQQKCNTELFKTVILNKYIYIHAY